MEDKRKSSKTKILLQTVLSVLLVSVVISASLANAQAEPFSKVELKQAEKLFKKLSSIFITCQERWDMGDFAVQKPCNEVGRMFLKHMQQLFNETRPQIESILIDY